VSQVRLNFLDWQPDKEDIANEGLTKATNVLHDTEGYKPLVKQTSGAFSVDTFYTATTLHSIRAMQVRQVGMNANRVAAIARDSSTTAGTANFTVGLEGESAPFTTMSSGTLSSAGGCRISSFSVAEMESGVFGLSAMFDASLLAGGSTSISITGEVTYTVASESEPTSGTGTTSLEGTNAEHTQTNAATDCYAGAFLQNDGGEYAFAKTGTQAGTLLSAWLDSGSVDGMWGLASLTAGSLDIDAGTQAWLSLTEDRAWGIRRATAGTGTATIELKTATDSAGENIIDTASYVLKAIREGVSLIGTTSSHTRTRQGADCTAGVSLNSNGTEYAHSNAGVATGTTLGSWLVGGAASGFYVRCTVLAGALTTGTEDTWQVLSTTRNYTVVQTEADVGPATAWIRIEIDTVGDGTNIIETAQYNLSAEEFGTS